MNDSRTIHPTIRHFPEVKGPPAVRYIPELRLLVTDEPWGPYAWGHVENVPPEQMQTIVNVIQQIVDHYSSAWIQQRERARG